MPVESVSFNAVADQDITKDPEFVPSSTKTIIFLDWDDTLLCSSVLSQSGLKLGSDIPEEVVEQLEDLSQSVIKVLDIALSLAEVHIVTNGETGWVELSAQKFLPNVFPYLEKMRVFSARSNFEKMCPNAPMRWKFHAFQESLAHIYTPEHTKSIKNILSFGDSHSEREAILAVTQGLPNTRTKSVKFAERPTIEQLKQQLDLMQNCIHKLVDQEDNLDLCMSLSVATPAEPAPEPTGA